MSSTADAKVRLYCDSTIMLVVPVTDLRKSVAKIEGPGVFSSDSSVR